MFPPAFSRATVIHARKKVSPVATVLDYQTLAGVFNPQSPCASLPQNSRGFGSLFSVQTLLTFPGTETVMNPPGNWSVAQNLIYAAVILATILITVGIIWLVSHFLPQRSGFKSSAKHLQEIHLVFEETLSAADRAIVRDQQVREATRFMLNDPALVEPLELWREKRREWASQLAFLEALGTDPSPEMLSDPAVADNLRHVHTLAFELEAAQRSMLRAIRQTIATGSENPPLGTESDN